MGGGAQNAIIDTTGEVRWFMNTDPIHDQYSVLESGPMLGFEQNKDGAYTWGFGQRYLKYDIMGRKIWNRRCLSPILTSHMHSVLRKMEIISCASLLQLRAARRQDGADGTRRYR